MTSAFELAVFAALVAHSDEAGHCHPSQATLAAITTLSERTIRTALKALEANDLIRRRPRSNRAGRQSDEFLLMPLVGNRHVVPVPHRHQPTGCATGTSCRGKEDSSLRESAPRVQTARKRVAA